MCDSDVVCIFFILFKMYFVGKIYFVIVYGELEWDCWMFDVLFGDFGFGGVNKI